MANTNRPFGLRPVRTIAGSPFNNQVQQFVTATDSGAIYPGSLVALSTGYEATLYTTGINALGVCVGRIPDVFSDPKYVPANTRANILVCTDPSMVYEIQQTNATTVTAGGSNVAGRLTDLTLTTGDQTRGIAQITLPSSTAWLSATSATALVRLVGVVDAPDNTATDVGARYLVTINENVFKSSVGPGTAV